MRIVLDTNVLISGMINPFGPPGRIVDLLRAGVVNLVVDDRILLEYKDVLCRPDSRKYFSNADRESIMVYLSKNSEFVIPTRHVINLPDSSDAPFIEVALESELLLVTGNTKHFPEKERQGVIVEAPGEFIKRFTYPT
jgi:uncharacterized protein